MDNVPLMGEKRNPYRIFVGKPEGKRPLGRPGRKWVDNIKMDLKEIRSGLEQGAVECSCEHGAAQFAASQEWFRSMKLV
jgi:hypothetical protein